MMSRGLSIWLDALRVAAAFAVLLGHFAHEKFTRGDLQFLRDANLGADAVIVFFVISGVVIAYAAERDASWRRFAFNRATRMLTVLLPAIVLTLTFDAIGSGLAPDGYYAPFYSEVAWSDAFWRGLTFTNEWTGISERLRIGTNGALWSLSYEATYYVIFAVAMFARGPLRILLIGSVAICAGLPIIVLWPAWFVGVLVWRQVSRPDQGIRMNRATALCYAAACPVLLVGLKTAGLPQMLSEMTATALAPINHHALLVYSDEVLWNLVIAGLLALHLLGLARLLEGVELHRFERIHRAVRWLAGASFSMYVVHYPTLHMLDAILPEAMPGRDLGLLGATIVTCLVFAEIFERPLSLYRGWLRTLNPGKRALRPGAGF